MTFDSFDQLGLAVKKEARAHPECVRLNGLTGEERSGDQNAWAFFKHNNVVWKIDADTKLLLLIEAHNYYQRTGQDPFNQTGTEKRDCLVVVPAVTEALVQHDPKYRRYKYHYIYSDK
jgi:hypothetical protein